MAQALSKGFINAGLLTAEQMIASDVDENIRNIIAKESGIRTTSSNKEVVECSNVIILAVKPHIVAPCLQEVSSLVDSGKLIVSIAAAVQIKDIEKPLPPGNRVVRVMPNTPALVGKGASVYSPGTSATPADGELVKQLFTSIGLCETLPERLLDAVTGVSGSGPAYIFMAIEAMADGGVKMGLPRDVAQRLAAQTALGAATMVIENGMHPGELKDAVCSPGGTTISAVHVLEERGYRASLIGAVEAATKRATDLGSKL